MNTTINIPVEIPQGLNINQLAHQLSEYAKTLIATNKIERKKKLYKHESMCGIFDDNLSQEDLVEDYLKEKYSLWRFFSIQIFF